MTATPSTPRAPRAEIAILQSVRDLAPHYDLWLCDVWGVIHNGEAAFGAAAEACARFRNGGGVVILVTNAPRPAASVAAQIAALGVTADCYDAIVSSGDVTRHLIARLGGRPAYHLGPERDRPIFEGLEVDLVPPEKAEVVINTGLLDDVTETPDDYAPLLARLAARRLPMICANPDRQVERGSQLVYCAGALAERYEQLGGAVTYAGKPYPAIYELCLARAAELRGAPVRKRRVLAIGDGLATDMRGAADFGLDALFVRSGVHVGAERPLDRELLEALFAGAHARPIAAIERLVW